MIKNYLAITFRNVIRNKGYSFINIAGLAVGMACCILLLLWVQDEMSFDRYHQHADDLYRVAVERHRAHQVSHSPRTPAPLASALKEDYPEIKNITRFFTIKGWPLKMNGEVFVDDVIGFTDSSAFDIFTIPFVNGDPSTALSDAKSIVLTENMSEKYFDSHNPIGEVLHINRTDFKVTGVIENIPYNSHLRYDCLIPFKFFNRFGKRFLNWKRSSFSTYVLLHTDSPGNELNRKISGFLKNHIPNSQSKLYLQPLTRIYHYSTDFKGEYAVTGDIKYVYIFSILAFFVLLTACLNFMNLATARAGKRSTEVGVRKVVGAQRSDIIRQFFGESLCFSFVALIFAIIMVILLLPTFNSLSGKHYTPAMIFTGNIDFILVLIGITILTGIISGIYPALFLSSFRPITVLRGALKPGIGSTLFRKILVVTQFVISVFLIIGALVISRQLDYIKNKELGFDKNNMVILTALQGLARNFEVFKTEMLKNPDILAVSRGFQPIWQEINTEKAEWEGKNPDRELYVQCYNVYYDYIECYRMEMAAGRSFSKAFTTDAAEGFIVNEAAVKAMGLESAVGKKFSLGDQKGKIIGVVKNFHHGSLHHQIQPLVLRMGNASAVCVRVKPGKMPGALSFLKKIWKKAVPAGDPFEYEFLDDNIDKFYRAEQRMSQIFRIFMALAIFISCLGLFGLVSFMAEQRTREIGIRKVLGASIPDIVLLLSKEFILLVAIANIIAWPAAYIVAKQWLQDFVYRTEMGVGIFILSAVLTLVIASVTVSFQSIKAAVANPVNTLKYE